MVAVPVDEDIGKLVDGRRLLSAFSRCSKVGVAREEDDVAQPHARRADETRCNAARISPPELLRRWRRTRVATRRARVD